MLDSDDAFFGSRSSCIREETRQMGACETSLVGSNARNSTYLHVYNMMGDPYKRQGVQSNANRWYVAQPSPRQQQVPLIGYNKGHP